MSHELTQTKVDFPSDNLRQIYELCGKHPKVAELLGILPQFRLVLDTNVVIGELRFVTKSRRDPFARSALKEVLDTSIVVPIAPTKMYEEVNRHLPRLAESWGVSEEQLREAWIELKAKIEFRESREDRSPGSTVIDPDDLPFVRLYWTSGADAVLTSDKDISLMGARAARPEAMRQLRDYARSKSPEVTLRIGGTLLVALPIGSVVLLFKIIGAALRGISNLPREIQLLLIGGALFAVIHRGSRRTIAAACSSLASNLELPAEILLDAFCELFMRLGEAQLDLKVRERAVAEVIPRRAETNLNSSIKLYLRNLNKNNPWLSGSSTTQRTIGAKRKRGRKAFKLAKPSSDGTR